MTFNWITVLNAAVTCLLVLPGALACLGGFRFEKYRLHPALTAAAFLTFALMILPLNVTGMEFGFPSALIFVITLVFEGTALILNDIIWLLILKKGPGRAALMAAVIIPSAVFLLNGAVLRHPLLLLSAAVLAAAGLYQVLLETEEDDDETEESC